MLQRLKRPGYWILLLAVLTVYFYRLHLKREKAQRRETLVQLYKNYGASVVGALGEDNLSGIQERLSSDRQRGIALEDIAMFVTTLHLERGPNVRWKSWEGGEGNMTLHGELSVDGNISYPVDMMVVRQGKKLLLHRLRVGPRILEPKRENFPFDTETERNASSSTVNTGEGNDTH